MKKPMTLLFLHDQDRVLLAMKKRGVGVGKWNGVGGKVEAGETIEQAMIRECQEEIGVTPLAYRQVAEFDFDFPGDGYQAYVYVYLAKSWVGEPTESEEMSPQWFTPVNIPYEQMWSDDKLWLPRILNGELLKGSFDFADDGSVANQTLQTVEDFGQ